MKSKFAIAGAVVAAILTAVFAVYAFANAPAKGSMGVWGYVASERDASLEVAERQGGIAKVTIDHVSVPEPAWIVVHFDEDGMPGKRVGLKHIGKGVSGKVEVKLDGVEPKAVIVAVHADRGTPGRFDFNMDAKTTSPDKPYFVSGKELTQTVVLR